MNELVCVESSIGRCERSESSQQTWNRELRRWREKRKNEAQADENEHLRNQKTKRREKEQDTERERERTTKVFCLPLLSRASDDIGRSETSLVGGEKHAPFSSSQSIRTHSLILPCAGKTM